MINLYDNTFDNLPYDLEILEWCRYSREPN